MPDAISQRLRERSREDPITGGALKLRQLSYLVAIADNSLNVTRAARRFYTSQSGVSKQIILLEEELGLRLFERRGRSFGGITTAGKQIIAHARVIVNEVDSIRATAQRPRSDPGGTIDSSSHRHSRPCR